MRLTFWMLASLAFTLIWWFAAASLSLSHGPLIYFCLGVLGIVIIAWPFGLISRKASLGRIATVSALSVAVLGVAFLIVGIIAGASASNANAPLSVVASNSPHP